jgi:hypothetical protein
VPPDKGLENLGQELSMMNVNTMEEGKVEGGDKKTRVGKEDEALPQLTVHTLEEVSARPLCASWIKVRSFRTG